MANAIVTPSLDNDASCYLCQIKGLLLSSLEVRIVGIVVKMQTHFATKAISIFPEPKVYDTCLYFLNDENNIWLASSSTRPEDISLVEVRLLR